MTGGGLVILQELRLTENALILALLFPSPGGNQPFGVTVMIVMMMIIMALVTVFSQRPNSDAPVTTAIGARVRLDNVMTRFRPGSVSCGCIVVVRAGAVM